MRNVHKSKLDKWLAAVMLVSLIIMAGSGLAVFVMSGFQIWWAPIPSVLVSGFIVWILVSTQYTLDGHLLIVQSGPFKWRVPITEITSVTPTNNPLSSPALSLDRLRIEYGNGKSIMISPEDKDRFTADLKAAGAAI